MQASPATRAAPSVVTASARNLDAQSRANARLEMEGTLKASCSRKTHFKCAAPESWKAEEMSGRHHRAETRDVRGGGL